MPPRFLRFLARRLAAAALLVLFAASAALVLARLAPGDHLSSFETDPEIAAAERRRLGLDRPLHRQYFDWAASLARLDLGESTRYPGRPVAALLAERLPLTVGIGAAALVLATLVGIPAGVVSGSRPRGALQAIARASSAAALAVPPVALSLLLLLLASRTGWFPLGGIPDEAGAGEWLRHLVLPVLALAIPAAGALERLQSRSMAAALEHRSVRAARARGIPLSRLVWRHAWRLSLPPVLAVYGLLLGGLLGGSFAVEYVLTLPGLGRLMYDALLARDASLVAGCAAAGAAFLALGVLIADVALAAADPRSQGST